MSGRITAITVDPFHPEVIYAGAASGGVWRSRSAGTGLGAHLHKAPTQSVGSLAINPKNPDEIWVGTGEGQPQKLAELRRGYSSSPVNGGRDSACMGLQTAENYPPGHRQ
jgi:hypothetical protein